MSASKRLTWASVTAIFAIALSLFSGPPAFAETNAIPAPMPGTSSTSPSPSTSSIVSRIGVLGPIYLSGDSKTPTIANVKSGRPSGANGPLATGISTSKNAGSDVLIISDGSAGSLGGIPGPQGATGATGATGARGPIGKDGKIGASAFDIWKLETGNVNATVADFMQDIQGPQGPMGPAGMVGPSGGGGGAGGTFKAAGLSGGCPTGKASNVVVASDGLSLTVDCVDMPQEISTADTSCVNGVADSLDFNGGAIKVVCKSVGSLIASGAESGALPASQCDSGQYSSALSTSGDKLAVVCRDIIDQNHYSMSASSTVRVSPTFLANTATPAGIKGLKAASVRFGAASTSTAYQGSDGTTACYENEMFGRLSVTAGGAVTVECAPSTYIGNSLKMAGTEAGSLVPYDSTSCGAAIGKLSIDTETKQLVIGCISNKELLSASLKEATLTNCGPNFAVTNLQIKTVDGLTTISNDCVDLANLSKEIENHLNNGNNQNSVDGGNNGNNAHSAIDGNNGTIDPNKNNGGTVGTQDVSGSVRTDSTPTPTPASTDTPTPSPTETSAPANGNGNGNGNSNTTTAGTIGLQGPIGPQGPKGDKGDTGAAGAQGLQGLSDYDIYLAQPGNQKKTPDEFFAFLASKVQVAGVQGLQGLPGASAADIWRASDPKNGHKSDADFLAAIKGDKGDTGAPGAAGATGATGAAGQQGPQGLQGLPGAKGADGASAFETWKNLAAANKTKTEADFIASLKGADGAAGATGPAGPAGAVGATGATGPAGPAGTTGFTEKPVCVLSGGAMYYRACTTTETKTGGAVQLTTLIK